MALATAAGYLDASMRVPLTPEVLAKAPNLRIVSCATTGSDHISRPAAEERNIVIRTLREDGPLLQNLTPAAELSWALLMACARKLPAALAHVHAGKWVREEFPGTMLNGRRLGLRPADHLIVGHALERDPVLHRLLRGDPGVRHEDVRRPLPAHPLREQPRRRSPLTRFR